MLSDLKNLAKQYNTASDELDKLHTNQQGDLPVKRILAAVLFFKMLFFMSNGRYRDRLYKCSVPGI